MSGYSDVVGKAQKEAGGGKYISLKNKGDKIVVRIASEPVYKNKHWMTGSDGKNTPITCTGDNCVYCGKDVPPKEKVKKTPIFAWVVLDRNDANTPKIFKGPFQIAKELEGLDNDPEWGDPRNYDVSVTRTEEPGSGYYKVVPTKNSDPISDDEKKAIEEAGFDLEAELEGGQKTDNIGKYGKAPADLETGEQDKAEETGETPAEGEKSEEDIPF